MKNDDYKEKYEKLMKETKILIKSNKKLSDRVEYLEDMNMLQEKIINSFKKMYKRDFEDDNDNRIPEPSPEVLDMILKFDSKEGD